MRNHQQRRAASLISAATAWTGMHWGISFAHATSYAASWIANGGGNWTDPTAWSIAPLYPNNNQPNSGDHYSAYIGPTSKTGVVIQAYSIGLDQLTFASPGNELDFGGTLTFGGSITAGSMELAGDLVINGDFNIASNLTWYGGEVSGFGNVNIASTGSIDVTHQPVLGTTFNNAGIISVSQLGSGVQFDRVGVLNNLSTGVINIANSFGMTAFYGGGYVTNAGIINITAGQPSMNVPMSDSGTINVSAGTLAFGPSVGLPTTFTFSGGAVVSGAGTVMLGNNLVIHDITGAATFSAAHFSMDGCGIVGPGTINLTSSMNWNSGTMGGTVGLTGPVGTLNVAPGATLNIGSNQTFLLGTINNSGTINVGSISGTGVLNNLAGGTMVISTAAPFVNSLNVNNSGTMVFPSGNKSLAGQFSDFGTMVLSNNAAVSFTGGTATYGGAMITGSGSYSIAGSTTNVLTGPLTFAVPLVSIGAATISGSGAINVASGASVGFATGITIAGPGAINIAKGGTASFDSGKYSQPINNSGTANFGNSSSSFTSASVTNIAGGVMNFKPNGVRYTLNWPFTNAGTVAIANGTLQLANSMSYSTGAAFSGAGTVALATGALNGSLNLYNPAVELLDATLTGPGDLNVYNTMYVNGGALSGAGAVNVSSGATFNWEFGSLGRDINNSGTANFYSSVDGGTITNQASGVVNIIVHSLAGLGSPTLFNSGTINFTSPDGNWNGMIFNNGTINIASGILNLNNTITHNNSYFIGAGTVNIGGFLAGNLTLAGSNQFLNGGWLNGPGDINVTSVLSWSSGTMDVGGGAVRIGPGATLNLVNNASPRTLNRALINSGTINASASLTVGTLAAAVGSITNTPSAYINANGFTMTSAAKIGNSGTINCIGGSNGFGFMNNTGTVIVGTATSPASVSMPAPVQYNAPGILTGGNWIVRGQSTMSWAGNIKVNQARVTLDGAGATLTCLSTVNTNQRSLSVLNGAMLATSGSFTNQAITTIGSNSVLQTTGTLTNTGTLDIDGLAIANYSGTSPQGDLASQIASGFAGGLWIGPGINSDLAGAVAANGLSIHKTAVGYAEASALGIVGTGTLDGQSVDDTTFILRYVYSGDSNLDGTVDSNDFALLAANFGGTGQGWVNGDYNYDGTVNALDFNALATNYGQLLSASAMPDQIDVQHDMVVPEPLLALPLLLTSLIQRRSRLNRP